MYIKIGEGLLCPCDITKELKLCKYIPLAQNLDHWIELTCLDIKRHWGVDAVPITVEEAERLFQK